MLSPGEAKVHKTGEKSYPRVTDITTAKANKSVSHIAHQMLIRCTEKSSAGKKGPG